MKYTPIKCCGNNWMVEGGIFSAWLWWTYKDHNWHEGWVRTGVRFCGFSFFLWKRKI